MDREIFIERPDELKSPPQKDKVIIEQKDDKILIHAPEVSKSHAVITIKNGEVFISDLDSLNGVYVNGFRIKEAMLNCRDNVVIAKKWPINSQLLKLFKTIDPDVDPNDYKKEFLTLKKVYEDYQVDKRNCNKIHQIKINILRVLMVTVPAVLFYAWATHKVPDPKNPSNMIMRIPEYFPIYLTISAVFPIFMNFLNLENKKAISLEREFKDRYICPKCKRVLNQDWYILRKGKECPWQDCKAIWSD